MSITNQPLWTLHTISIELGCLVYIFSSTLVLVYHSEGIVSDFHNGTVNTPDIFLPYNILVYLSSLLLFISRRPDFPPTFDTDIIKSQLPALWHPSRPC